MPTKSYGRLGWPGWGWKLVGKYAYPERVHAKLREASGDPKDTVA